MDLSEQDHKRLYEYVQQNFGIDLSRKRVLIVNRLQSTLKADGYSSFHDYVNDIISGKSPEMTTQMLNKLTTNYTYFMREAQHYKYLQEVVMPYMARKHERDHVLSVWSAGCSSGEEPYNISMYLLEYFGKLPGRWDTRILATDLSHNILATAINPSYPPESMEKLPKNWISKYFIHQKDDTYRPNDLLKKNVIFRPFNLMDPIHFKLKFDLIFCRNVMIYFDQPTKDALVQRFYDATEPGGYLFIGHSEGVTKATCPYSYLMPAIYRKEP